MSDYTNPSGTTNTSKNDEAIGRSISELLDLQLALGSIIKNIVDRLVVKETIEASDIEHYSHLMKRKIDNTLRSVPQANCEMKESTDEKNKPAAEQNDEIKGGGRVDKEQIFFDNKALALNIAHGYFEDKYAAVEREDYEQMALMYLWEASMEYKESEQTKFSTFATTYIKKLICGLLPAHKAPKRAALYQRETDRNQENDNLEESLKNLEAENTGEDSLSYQLLRLDLERDLLRERRKLRKSEKSTAAGLEILYAILKGVSGAEIMETMEIPESSYYRCVKKHGSICGRWRWHKRRILQEKFMIEEKLLTESFFSQRTSKIKRFVEVHRFARFLNKIVPKEKKIVLVGIGDPEVHADYVGPNSIALIQYFMDSVPMYGNILFPVKGGNTNEYAKKLREKYPDSVIIGIDATIGKAETGTIIISNRPVNPGSGMNLHYDPMGDVSILGIIGESQGLVLAKKNDEAIDRMTEFIAEAIICWVTNYRHQALTDGNFFEKAPFAPTAREDK